ncbi:unnamed protein product, partial [Clonostachys byssicola]
MLGDSFTARVLNNSRQDQLEAHQAQLFWIAYLQESQLLAEFDFPPSGLGKLAGSVALPLVPNAGTDPHHAKYQFFFLALISMRKLLNRVLYHVYKQVDQISDTMKLLDPPVLLVKNDLKRFSLPANE